MFEFSKVRNVKSPSRSHPGDAGIDFYIPDDIESMLLMPKNRIAIPSGIRVNVPFGYALIALNKSGIAHTLGLIVTAQVVDSGYQGEVHLCVHNLSDAPVRLQSGNKLVQFIYMPVVLEDPKEVEEKDLYPSESERGENGFGSTSK